MSESYVWAGYGITVGALSLYAAWVVRRGRVLARSLPPDDAEDQ
ncbi:MAG TPA: heme exporter protein CcmD [Acidimicrobiales bacterium]|nr:heme exporter protein CcmD [Acidimicrobiales bacterium]